MDACSEAILSAFKDIKLMGMGIKDMVANKEIDLADGIGFEHVGPAIERGKLLCQQQQ